MVIHECVHDTYGWTKCSSLVCAVEPRINFQPNARDKQSVLLFIYIEKPVIIDSESSSILAAPHPFRELISDGDLIE